MHPCHRGHGVAAALLRELEQRTRESGAPVFAAHGDLTSPARTLAGVAPALWLAAALAAAAVPDALALPARPWPALAYLKPIDACPAAFADAA